MTWRRRTFTLIELPAIIHVIKMHLDTTNVAVGHQEAGHHDAPAVYD
jgi:hypothetical protein